MDEDAVTRAFTELHDALGKLEEALLSDRSRGAAASPPAAPAALRPLQARDAPPQGGPMAFTGQAFTAPLPQVNDARAGTAPLPLVNKCPAHGYEWKSNKRGQYCSGKGVEGWSDPKGYCAITPQNAAQYVAAQGQ